MIAELGHFSLWLALAIALVLGVVPLVGAHRQRADWVALARIGTFALGTSVTVAFLALGTAFVLNDFSVLYVASNSNRALPLAYRLAAVWGGHEGSMLLWMQMLCLWMVAVALFGRSLPRTTHARILAVMGLLAAGLLGFIVFTSNPFVRLWPAPADGNDLNPLLQDPGMVAHPPMLYMGYVGFSVAYAFAIAALMDGKLDATWARWTRPWTTAAWMFLTLGIAIGSMWAYYELGWGGWWFWDPVENASLMPWLVGTALMHSLAVTEKRGSFRAWTVLLAIVTFSLSLLGTFLVRSGVLSSVHAFATDPRRGLFILTLLTLVAGASLALYAWRAHRVGLGAAFELLSKETALLVNNVLLVSAAASVLLGTLYPLFLDALDLGKISVGPPYFETIFVPLMVPTLFLLGVGPLARWKSLDLPPLLLRLKWAAILCLVGVGMTALAYREWRPATLFGFGMAFWIVGTTAVDIRDRTTAGATRVHQVVRKLAQISLAQWGMWVAHLGVAVFCLGVTAVNSYEVESDVRAGPGDSASAGGYTFVFQGVQETAGPNYRALQGTVQVQEGGTAIARLTPEKRLYRTQSSPMTEAAIHPGLWRDIYVALGEEVASGEWTLRLYVKPLVSWIWGGCLLMAIGAGLALFDRRYRKAPNRAST